MFGWFSNKRINELEKKTQSGFDSVKIDIGAVGKWIKHLDKLDKQLFDLVSTIKSEIAEINDENENKQLFKKLPVLPKQVAVEDIQNSVQTAVQTDNLYGILKKLSSNERLLVLTLMQSDMRLSYEDIALLLGKERSTVRGQINSIKQKMEGLIFEVAEKNGKKRVYISEELKRKMAKYAKVRNGGKM